MKVQWQVTFSVGRDLDITSDSVKVMPFQSAKGLEFPIVAIAGLWPSNYPYALMGASSAEVKKIRAPQRRTLFVAKTRAMRALALVKPITQATQLLLPLDSNLWNLRI